MIHLESIPNTKSYPGSANALRFLLGGIGTGNISLDAKGALCDFEIFGRPSKGLKLPYSFFAMRYAFDNGESNALVLEAKHRGLCDEPMGVPPGHVPGLPRFDSSTFTSAYPFAQVALHRDGLPLEVTLQAFTPFIPLDDKNSGIPVIRLTYRVKNISAQTVDVAVAATMPNACGMEDLPANGLGKLYLRGQPHNEVVSVGGLQGVAYSTDVDPGDLSCGTMALLTDADDGFSAKPCWLNEGWWDGAEEFWQDFTADGALHEADAGGKERPVLGGPDSPGAIGSIAVRRRIAPGEAADYVFYLAWHFPNRYGWWPDGYELRRLDLSHIVFRNYYATLWSDAVDAAVQMHANIGELERLSEAFARTLFSSTVDPAVIDAAASTITVLRSPTCFRIADGTFFGWEGCFAQSGSCAGTCTHVWNYAQTVANLFPALERSARETELLVETDDEGKMNFRAKIQLAGEPWEMHAAVDGQLGSVLRVYREWKMSGDDAFLRRVWPKLVPALEYAETHWDSDGDFVLDGKQHNTYDIEFYGISSLGNVIYYAALKAAAKMAAHLGDDALAAKWTAAYESGAAKMDALLFNGEYYRQLIDDVDRHKYQYGEGCLSDQLLGQTLAHLYGLGYLLPEEHVRKAAASIYRYNFRTEMGSHMSLQRGYAWQDEPGLLLCSWPTGGRPAQPFVYSDEVWTGIEYHVATHLIYEGLIDEALTVVRAVRSRYDGSVRSPFNEIECGNHYARSMASWGLLIALSGLEVDLPHGRLSIAPRVNEDSFACFYATGREWGVAHQIRGEDGALKQWFEPLYHAD